MAGQSHAPTILLTRPLARSRRFARQLRARSDQPLRIIIAPLMQLSCLVPPMPLQSPNGLIFTSEAGVAAWQNLPNRPVAPVWCVGQQTAKAARIAISEPVLIAPDAITLIAQIKNRAPKGPLLHLRGQDAHGNIASTLSQAGIPTDEVIVYTQSAIPLALHAQRLLQSGQPVIVPVFSARSAKLFFAVAPSGASITVAALSGAVAAAIPPDTASRIVVSPTADADGMLETVRSLLMEPASA